MTQSYVATQRATLLANNLNIGTVFDWLVERFGPALSELLLDLLTRKSQANLLPQQDVFGGFDLRALAVVFLERFGQSAISAVSDFLDARSDLLAKLIASVLRQYSNQILQVVMDWLNSADAEKVISDMLNGAALTP